LVKLLDTELSVVRLALRILIALLLSSFSLVALYFVPRVLIDYLSSGIPDAQLLGLLNQLLDQRAPTLGILVSILVLVTVTLRKTKLEGPLLICLGASLITYSYILLHGGTVNLQIPAAEIQRSLGINIPMSIQAHLSVNITTLMLASVCPPLLIIVKGAILTSSRLRKGVESP
jgi:hypothetical protein